MDEIPETADDKRARQEAELRGRVALAKVEYEHAKAEARRLLDSASDLGRSNPDSTSAISQATRIQQLATRRYTEALKAFTAFVLARETELDTGPDRSE